MSGMAGLFLLLLLLVGAGLVGAFLHRRDSGERLARRWGWEYEDGPLTLGGRLKETGVECLPRLGVYRRRCLRLYRGQHEDIETVVLHLAPEEGSYLEATMACFRLPGRSLPRFALRSRREDEVGRQRYGYLEMEEGGFRKRVVELKDNEGFSQYYDLWGFNASDQEVGWVVRREVQDWFMLHRERSWQVEAAGEWIAVTENQMPLFIGSDLQPWLKEVSKVHEVFARATSGAADREPG